MAAVRRRSLVALATLVVITAHSCSAEASYSTVYACEGSTLKLECKEDELINLIRANFGRFSITICNEKGNTDWSVNCMSPRSLRVLEQSCGVGNKCSVDVSAEKFGDSCPGTFKYIEVHYNCVSAASTTTTKRPHPPWYSSYPDPNLWLTSGTTTSRRPPTTTTTTTTTTRRPRLPGLPPKSSNDGMQVVIPGVTRQRQQGSRREKVEQDGEGNLVTVIEEEGQQETVNRKKETTTTTTTTTTTAAPVTTSAATVKKSTTSKPTTKPTTTRRSRGSSRQPAADAGTTLPGPWLAASPHYCPARTSRGLRWNYTRAGDVAVLACPGGATGYARWPCHHGTSTSTTDPSPVPGAPAPAQWASSPDLSECKSVLMAALEERLLDGEHTLRVASELAQVTDRSDSLLGGDVRTAARLVNHLASRQAQQLIGVPDVERREAIVTELTQHVVRAASNVLDAAQRPAWQDLGGDERRRAATSLLIGLEQNAFLLSDNVVPDRTVMEIDRNLLMTVHNKKVEGLQDLMFPSEVALRQWDISGNSMRLSRQSLVENSRHDSVKVVFLAYSGLDSVLEPLNWPERRREASRYSRAGAADNSSRIVNSLVLSASLGEGRHIQLSEPVQMQFRHLLTENVTNPSCCFWDYTVNMWSDEGCRVTYTNRTHTMCECDHLTSFAVLMDVFAEPLVGDERALRIVIYVGCAIALLCLCATLLALILLRGLQSDRTSIHKNLIVCLLVVELAFLVGLHQTGQPVVCGVLAGLMHFFLMAAFFWLFLEAFQLYVTLTVFEGERSRLRWYYVAAYGVPLLIVAVSCVVDPISYGTEDHCWLRTDNYFVFSFAGPAIILILLTATFLGLAVFVMLQHSSAAITIKTREQSRLSYIRTWLRAALVLLLLLLLTWTFGLVFLDQRTVVMAYLFTVFNALLGLFIFGLHCVQNEKVRSELDSHGLLPVCLKTPQSLARDHAEALSTSNGTINTVLNLSTQNNIPRLWSPHAPSNPKSATLNSLNPSQTPSGSLRRGTMRSSMPAKLRSNIAGEMLAEKAGVYNFQSHDSGHGTGSENESPHLTLNNVRYLATAPTMERPAAVLVPVPPNGDLGPRVHPEFFAVYQQQVRRGAGRGGRSHSPYHTYMEVDGDPVYEEIERQHEQRGLHLHDPRLHEHDPRLHEHDARAHELMVSDVSDESDPQRKHSDMSRQSSRNYSDSRPLIPYGVERAAAAGGGARCQLVATHGGGGGAGGSPAHCEALSEARLRDFDQAQMYHDLRRLQRGFGENVAMAVLNGDQVVCTLQSPHAADGATVADRERPSHSRFAEC